MPYNDHWLESNNLTAEHYNSRDSKIRALANKRYLCVSSTYGLTIKTHVFFTYICWHLVFSTKHTLRKTNIAPENGPSQKETIVFQPSIFRGENVSSREGIYSMAIFTEKNRGRDQTSGSFPSFLLAALMWRTSAHRTRGIFSSFWSNVSKVLRWYHTLRQSHPQIIRDIPFLGHIWILRDSKWMYMA